jgi:hypothetical protein
MAQSFVLRTADMLRASFACALASTLVLAGVLGGCSGPGLEPPSSAAGFAPSSPVKDDDGNAGAPTKPPGTAPSPGAGAMPMPAPAPIEPGEGEQCSPDCGLRSCGSDGCGGSCGTCASGSLCGADGQCGCSTDCDAGECADDAGCGDECDACSRPVDAGL